MQSVLGNQVNLTDESSSHESKRQTLITVRTALVHTIGAECATVHTIVLDATINPTD